MFPLSCKSAAKTRLTDAKISTVNAFKYVIIFIKIESPLRLDHPVFLTLKVSTLCVGGGGRGSTVLET